jgi:hypothetical protein
MLQNQLTAPRTESIAQVTHPKQSLRGETERALGEIAYALQLTRTVKKAILEEKGRNAAAK